MKKVALVYNSDDITDTMFMINRSLDRAVENNISLAVFTDGFGRQSKIPCFHIADLYTFNGDIVAFDVEHASKIQTYNRNKRHFYIPICYWKIDRYSKQFSNLDLDQFNISTTNKEVSDYLAGEARLIETCDLTEIVKTELKNGHQRN